eukprot:SAG11_NODE_1866_length_4152_cov_15.643967_6_plen_70_part_00
MAVNTGLIALVALGFALSRFNTLEGSDATVYSHQPASGLKCVKTLTHPHFSPLVFPPERCSLPPPLPLF